jgi:CRP-like cAMP-binding protein
MDSIESRIDALKKMPLMVGLPHGELESLAKRMTVESYEEGTEIIKQGSSGASAYFVVSGRCDVRRGPKKSQRRLAFLGPGDFFGELSIIAPAPRSASVIAHEATVVLVLTGYEFRSALSTNRSMSLHLVKILAQRLQREIDEFGG